MRTRAITFEGWTNSYDLVEAIFNRMDDFSNVEREHYSSGSYPTEYFTITIDNSSFRIMIQSNGSSWMYVCPCNSQSSGGQYLQRYKLTLSNIAGSQVDPEYGNFTRMRWFTTDDGDFAGFSVPYYNSQDNPQWWMVTKNNEGYPIFIESENNNVWKMTESPYSAGLLVSSFSRFHESNETVFIEQALYTAGEGGGIPELWCVYNNTLYHLSQLSGAFMYVGTEDGYYMKLRGFVWAKIAMVDQDERIVIQTS